METHHLKVEGFLPSSVCEDVVNALIDIIKTGEIKLLEEQDNASEENIDNIGNVQYVD